jgi:preprotein translocase subunit SecY
MFETLRNAWKVQEIRKKIFYTLMILFLYRLGCFVPVPGLNAAYLQEQLANYDLLQLMSIMSGGALGQWTLFALGVGPYITSSIIMQLLTMAIPALERLAKEGGEEGRKKIQQYTRYAAIAMALIESIGIIMSLGSTSEVLMPLGMPAWLQFIVIGVVLTAGTTLVMWLGERISEKGIGNGVSLIIFIGIISGIPGSIQSYVTLMVNGYLGWWIAPVIVIGLAAIITGVTFIDLGSRKIPVQYAKQVKGRRIYGGQSSHIPLKITQSGVLPLIFAMSLTAFPQLILQAFFSTTKFYTWWMTYLGTGTVIYMIVYAVLIVFFSYFATSMSFNPYDVAKDMQQYGGFIPGIRPGRPTAEYIRKISNRLTLFGAIFLMVVAVIPTIFTALTGMNSVFGPTSILIMVSVALETVRTLEAQLLARNYRGFLK